MARSRKTPASYETNPTDTRYRVLRGGGWVNLTAAVARAANRYINVPTARYDDIGFRCAQRGCRQQILKATP